MARGALNWSAEQLANASGVHRNTVSNFERGKHGGAPENIAKMKAALEAAGVVFTNGDAPGVKLKAKARKGAK